MRILITGVGVVGKSTLRRRVKNLISKIGIPVEDIDSDYQKMPIFKEGMTYVIEDVHGPMTEEAFLPLEAYHLILYLLPTPFCHLIFWLKRMTIWFKEGKGSWDRNRQGWLGSGKRYDILNVSLFVKLMIYDFCHRRLWLAHDLEILYSFKNVVLVRPQWTSQGIKFNLVQFF